MSEAESKHLLTADQSDHDPVGHDGFRQYRAPRGNGRAFVEPSFEHVPALLKQNHQTLETHGESFRALRESARRQLIEAAVRYTAAYRNVDWVAKRRQGPIIMAGHQPAIFHPGVWFKNFALGHVADQTHGIAINMIVDNDVAETSSIRVPVVDRTTGVGSFRAIPYDHAGGGIPYEQTTIRDLQQFDCFDQQVAEAIRPVVSNPSVLQLWQHARAAIARCGVAGCALAQARHGLEGELGLETLELPLGVICRTTAFAEFALSILDQLPRFQACYNTAAGNYRKAHGIRSTAHPVPDLANDESWLEAPLWIYGDNSPARRPTWVRRENNLLVISDRQQRELKIDTKFPKLAAETLANQASPNFKLRPRALLTTMYCRLVLSDLFLHGIGGGKYDQLGDVITRQFFAFEPPQFMVVSATIQLPGFTNDGVTDDLDREIARLHRAIRDTLYQGEQFADRAEINPADVKRKLELLARVPPRGQRNDWQRKIEEVNDQLSEQLESLRSEFRKQLEDVRRRKATAVILHSREHPFCLFPLEYLTNIYQKLLT